MKIAINATFRPTGGAINQLVNMVHYILKEELKHKPVIYVNKNTLALLKKEDLNECDIRLCNIPGYSVIFRILWEQILLPLYLLRDNVDLLFCPGNISPIFSKSKTIVWIGTIGPFFDEFYENFNLFHRFKLRINKYLMILSSLGSSKVIFESKFTRDIFVEKYGVKINKTHVINIGKDDFFSFNQNNFSESNIKTKKPYLLCVSHLYPYKNIIRMLKAFSISSIKSNESFKLYIAGSQDYLTYYKSILKTIDNLNLKNKVVLLGAVSKQQLKELYSNCYLMIFPSPFENFAYTLAEAMSCGAPIICSNTTAMPETCQSAALYFDPYDISQISDKLTFAMSNKNVVKNLKKMSIKRANELPNYRQATEITLKIIKDLED